ncbi:YibE/F family protein [Trueperella pyogenes]|uniref:YibE/F family protein n=1 Tax=Trueperella pyogenes TaxID=1661 RepID=UPI001E45DCC1|nr:YibE/F family protein [Trueperella pyogenes]WHU56880.1 YibE/F family protein [Trueperella pyogenes]
MASAESPVGHVHSHAAHLDLAPKDRRRVQVILAAIVVPLAIATIVGLVLLWPRGATPVGSLPLNHSGVSMVVGEITSVSAVDDLGQHKVTMKVDGVEVPLHVPFEIIGNGLDVGDTVKAMFNPGSVDAGAPYIFVDFVRGIPLSALLIVYVVVVIAVARWKGFAALLGLGASLAVVGAFMLPALMVGHSPLAVVIVGASAMMFASIYFAHGVSIRTTTAVLGTLGGLVITGVLAVWAVSANNLTGTLSEDAISLAGHLNYLKMSDILLCGIILAGLGALNDVTITQVSTVWELHSANIAASRIRVFQQAMVIGRDHIASTVYTLAFAYVGTSLPLLMSAALVDRGFLDLLAVGQIAEEIVRTLVASIGLVLAIPMTTAIATLLAPVAPARKVNE